MTVQVKSQSKCTISPKSPSFLTKKGGRLGKNTKNVRIECRCIDADGIAPKDIIWLSPDKRLIRDKNRAARGAPYFEMASANGVPFTILVIPNFSDAYNGSYTCTTGSISDVNDTIGLICM